MFFNKNYFRLVPCIFFVNTIKMPYMSRGGSHNCSPKNYNSLHGEKQFFHLFFSHFTGFWEQWEYKLYIQPISNFVSFSCLRIFRLLLSPSLKYYT